MEPLRDRTWMKYLLTGTPAERVERAAYSAAMISVPRTEERHNERYRYRAFFFEPEGKIPVLAVNLESDILGEFLLTVQDARDRGVLGRYDYEPPFDEFRGRALDEADRRFGSRASVPKKPRRGAAPTKNAR